MRGIDEEMLSEYRRHVQGARLLGGDSPDAPRPLVYDTGHEASVVVSHQHLCHNDCGRCHHLKAKWITWSLTGFTVTWRGKSPLYGFKKSLFKLTTTSTQSVARKQARHD